nr:hypothetical protein [Chelativorans alearense]
MIVIITAAMVTITPVSAPPTIVMITGTMPIIMAIRGLFDAAHVLDVLRAPPVKVAPGTIEAASAHIATLIARIRLVNRQLKQAHHRLDALTARLIPTRGMRPSLHDHPALEVMLRVIRPQRLRECVQAARLRYEAVIQHPQPVRRPDDALTLLGPSRPYSAVVVTKAWECFTSGIAIRPLVVRCDPGSNSVPSPAVPCRAAVRVTWH